MGDPLTFANSFVEAARATAAAKEPTKMIVVIFFMRVLPLIFLLKPVYPYR
jgi:hypothetical protein